MGPSTIYCSVQEGEGNSEKIQEDFQPKYQLEDWEIKEVFDEYLSNLPNCE